MGNISRTKPFLSHSYLKTNIRSNRSKNVYSLMSHLVYSLSGLQHLLHYYILNVKYQLYHLVIVFSSVITPSEKFNFENSRMVCVISSLLGSNFASFPSVENFYLNELVIGLFVSFKYPLFQSISQCEYIK